MEKRRRKVTLVLLRQQEKERLMEIRQQHEGFVSHKAKKKQLHAQIVTLLTMH